MSMRFLYGQKVIHTSFLSNFSTKRKEKKRKEKGNRANASGKVHIAEVPIYGVKSTMIDRKKRPEKGKRICLVHLRCKLEKSILWIYYLFSYSNPTQCHLHVSFCLSKRSTSLHDVTILSKIDEISVTLLRQALRLMISYATYRSTKQRSTQDFERCRI